MTGAAFHAAWSMVQMYMPGEYRLTARYAELVADSEPCECTDMLLLDDAVSCRECGTVYAVISPLALYGLSSLRRRRR